MNSDLRSEVLSWIKSIGTALIIVFIVRTFIFTPTTVYGESMSPSFEDKDRVIISKISNISRFDIIVFDAPDEDEQYIKRVIGLPGDTIEMKDDILYINGIPHDEPYLKKLKDKVRLGKLTGDFTLEELTGHATVPEGSYFVLGDNRMISKDSRYFGFISEEVVWGEVKFQIFPLNKIGIPK